MHGGSPAARPAFSRSELSAALLQESSLPFFVSLGDGTLLLANEAFQRLVGYTEEELENDVSWASHLTPPQWLEIETPIVERVGRTGKPERYEKEYVRSDGAVVPVEMHLHSKLYEGSPVYYGFAMDITAEIVAKKALADSERHLRSIFENAAVGIAHVGLDGRWIRTNETLARMLGYTAEQLAELTFSDITHPDDLEADRAQSALLHDGAIDYYRIEKRYLRGDGEYLWTELTGSAVRKADGSPEYYIAVVSDISARKQAEYRAQEELQRTELLLDAMGSLFADLDLDQVCQTLAGLISDVLENRRVLVGVFDAAVRTVAFKGTRGTRVAPEILEHLSAVPCVCAESLDTGQTRIFDRDVEGVSEKDRRFADDLGIRLSLCVPIMSDGEPLGLIVADVRGERRPFSEGEVAITEALAAKAAVAIRNAQHFGRQRHIAGVLQNALLALPKKIEGISFAHVYRSATKAARVGGDFLDIFPLPKKKVALLIGDVSGKGLDAAVTTAVMRNSIRAYALDNLSPAQVLSKTNDLMREFTRVEVFATAFLAQIDLETGKIVYANGGHPAPICVGSEGDAWSLEGSDPLIGAFDDVRFHDRVSTMPLGYTLVAFTDGVTESRKDGELFGHERALASARRVAGLEPEEICGALYDDVRQYAGSRLEDDVAIIAVKRAGKPAERRDTPPLF